MKRKLIGLTLTIFILTGVNVFGQVQWCDIDFGCFLTDDWKPTLPPSGSCHATTPDLLKLYARSCWSDGRDCPINWAFQLQAPDYNSDDCYTNGCHKHSRVLDPSQYQNMLTSSGGLRLDTGLFSNAMNKGNSSYFEFNAARPEASGIMKLSIRASIPPNCDVVSTLEHNPGWILCDDDPEHYFCTSMALPYHINGLVELPDGDNYLKSSDPGQHVEGHQFYCKLEMVDKVRKLAELIRSKYQDLSGMNVKISFNDLSLEYGGIFDYNNQWNCDHKLHRVGKSMDPNSTECLVCDPGQTGCITLSSADVVVLEKKDTKEQEIWIIKEWIDSIAQMELKLIEKHKSEYDRFMHLEME